MDKLVIDRSKWKTGSAGLGMTSLRNRLGFMCCLGFRCIQLGVPEDNILLKDLPSEISDFDWKNEELVCDSENTNFALSAARINDNTCLENKEREEQLIDLFKANDIELSFTGEYVYEKQKDYSMNITF